MLKKATEFQKEEISKIYRSKKILKHCILTECAVIP